MNSRIRPVNLKVGILKAAEITVTFNGQFISGSGAHVSGTVTLTSQDIGKIFTPCESGSSFTLHDVKIGIGYHWEQQQDQTFTGSLSIIPEDGGIRAVNIVDLEDYLRSVISSEMSAESSPALLRAHTVISRSWVLAQITGRRNSGKTEAMHEQCDHDSIVRWWDREDHDTFDVCADDHCQRYQGISAALLPEVTSAVDDTAGIVLANPDGTLVDARFSKCCGGATELFSSCWGDESHPCLRALRDSPDSGDLPDLRNDATASQWILSRPDAFCARATPAIIRQVLNDYDRATTDFYRWRVEWDNSALSANISARLGVDVGAITALTPLARGTSGRITSLRIVGSLRSITIGKELLIRRVLSESHLYSSAFVVEYDDRGPDGVPRRIILHGAGWGHGVGLCQIGAAVMGAEGYDYRRILAHYFPGSTLVDLSDILENGQ